MMVNRGLYFLNDRCDAVRYRDSILFLSNTKPSDLSVFQPDHLRNMIMFRGTGPRVSLADQCQSAAVACTGTDISKGLACGPSGSQAPFDISGWDLGALHVSFPLVAKSFKLFSNKQDIPIILILLIIVRYEMRFNMKKGLASQKKLSESAVDFPRVNENYTGRYDYSAYEQSSGKVRYLLPWSYVLYTFLFSVFINIHKQSRDKEKKLTAFTCFSLF
ncbi:hypothetical protein FXO37_35981 [Capsicum annuum]|nr:hypothetical protein FXO37_35981 [Capsicum annuum]